MVAIEDWHGMAVCVCVHSYRQDVESNVRPSWKAITIKMRKDNKERSSVQTTVMLL